MVGQEPVLFSGTVRDNIAYGLPGCSMKRVKEAASKANAHDFISKLENGYDTGKETAITYHFNSQIFVSG